MHTFVNTFYILFLTKIQFLKMSKNEKSKILLEKTSIVTEKKFYRHNEKKIFLFL